MAYQRRSFNLVTPPPVTVGNPLAAASDLYSLASQARSMRQQTEADASNTAIRDALTIANGDYMEASKVLGQQGRHLEATRVKDVYDQTRNAELDRVSKRLSQHQTIYGRGAQVLQEVQANPALYGQLRPTLVDLASQIDPQLAQAIPEQYEPARFGQLMQFVQSTAAATDSYARAVAKLKAAEQATDDGLKRLKLHREALGHVLSVADTEEEWTQALSMAQSAGVLPQVLAEFGGWSPDAPMRAVQMLMTPEQRANAGKAPSTIEAALLQARQAGDKAGVNELLKLADGLSDARRADDDTSALATSATTVETVMRYPAVWNDLSPTMREKLLPGLSAAGFDFNQAAEAIPSATKSAVERWRADQITSLNTQRRDNAITEADYQTEIRRIEQSYRAQLGRPTRPADQSGGAAQRSRDAVLPPSLRAGAAPSTAAGPQAPRGPQTPAAPQADGRQSVGGYSVGQSVVSRQTGQRHTILGFTADGKAILDPNPVK